MKFLEGKNIYYNYEIYSNIIHLDNFDVKIKFDKEDIDFLTNFQDILEISLKIIGFTEFIKNEFALPIEKLNLYENNISNTILNFTLINFNSNNNNNNIIDFLKPGFLTYIKYVTKEL